MRLNSGTTWLSLSLLMGVGLTILGVQKAPGEENKGQVTQAAKAHGKSGEKDRGPSCDQAQRKRAAELLADLRSGAGQKMEVLFATVAEPTVSGFGFDQQLDAMKRALEQKGRYALDRFWLPWRPAEAGKGDEGGSRDVCPDRFPGVMLFRCEGGPGLLALFLIGETPTGGIHQAAFEQAMDDAAEILPAALTSARLVGPTFSGSAQSLRIAVGLHPEVEFDVITGSATNPDNWRVLQRDADHPIRFRSTVLPDDVVQEEFYDYLVTHLGAREQKHVLRDVAVLVESTTAYGQGLLATHLGSHAYHPRLVLPYPIHISRLHSAWRKDRSGKPEPNDGNEPRLALPRTIESPDRGDIPPMLSPNGVQRDDLALTNLLTTISREQIRYVGLFTLDAEDKSFLAQQLHKFCPDVRLFTLESDVLDAHPDDQLYFRGMLVASTYPLFNRNQQWTFPFQGEDERLQFTSNGAQGVYNATLALLDEPGELLEYAAPFVSSGPRLAHPPVWISAIGRGTLVPLATSWPVHERADQWVTRSLPPSTTAVAPGSYLRFQFGVLQLAILVLGVLVSLICAGYFYVNLVGVDDKDHELDYPWRMFVSFRPLCPSACPIYGQDPQRRTEQRWQHVYLLTCFASLTGIYMFLTHLFFMQHRSHQSPADESGWLMAMSDAGLKGGLSLVCCVGLLAVILHILYRMVADSLGEKPELPYRRPILSVIVLVLFIIEFFAACFLMTSWLGRMTDGPVLLLLNRLGNPGYGLSPAVPLLCLATALSLWGYSGLRRLSLVAAAADPHFVKKLCPDNGKDHGDAGGQAVKRMLASQQGGPSLTLIIIVVCAVLLYPVLIQVKTLEGRLIDWVFMLSFGLLYALVIRVQVRFLMLWFYFQRFLRFLSAQPMIDAYDRLPAAFSRTVGIQLLERIPLTTELEGLWRHFCLLANHFEHFQSRVTSDLQGSLDAPKELLERFKAKVDAAQTYQTLSLEERQAFFLDVYDALNAILERFWGKRPLKSALAGKLPVDQGPSILTTNTATLYMRFLPDEVHLWLRLAEDFIAIQVVTYISHVFPLLRTLLIFVVSGMLLLLASLNMYPFQPQHLLLSLCWVMILSIVTLTLLVFVQMNRDEVLSRIAKSEPGKITWDRLFISPLLIYVAFPLLTLVSSQLPEIRGPLLSWVEPFLRALK